MTSVLVNIALPIAKPAALPMPRPMAASIKKYDQFAKSTTTSTKQIKKF